MMMTGSEFNKQHPNIAFIKLVNEKSCSNGLYFGEGLNVFSDKSVFTENNTKGMIFSEIDDAIEWKNFDNEKIVYMFDVKIPNDAIVYTSQNIMKSNMLLLSNKRLVNVV